MNIKLIISHCLILAVGLSAGAVLGYVIRSIGITDTEAQSNEAPSHVVQTSGENSTKVAVVFQPEEFYSTGTKKELNEKLVNPLSDYSKEDGKSVSALIISSTDKQKGPWDVFVIYQDGTNRNFFYGNAKQKVQTWWIPDCLTKCEFSEEFKNKYPEVVKLAPS